MSSERWQTSPESELYGGPHRQLVHAITWSCDDVPAGRHRQAYGAPGTLENLGVAAMRFSDGLDQVKAQAGAPSRT